PTGPLRPQPASPSAAVMAATKASRLHRSTDCFTCPPPCPKDCVTDFRTHATKSYPPYQIGVPARVLRAGAHKSFCFRLFFLFVEPGQPFPCLSSDIFRRGATEAGAARDRALDRQYPEHRHGHPLLHRLHRRKQPAIKRHARLSRPPPESARPPVGVPARH